YGFGGGMVGVYAGFTPKQGAATYAAGEMTMAMPPGATVVVERAGGEGGFGGHEMHRGDRGLLGQDTHVHVPMDGVIATLLSVVVLGLRLTPRSALALITLLFSAPWLDFAGMWLTKLVAQPFAWLVVIGGWAMGVGYTIVTGLALWHMWVTKQEER